MKLGQPSRARVAFVAAVLLTGTLLGVIAYQVYPLRRYSQTASRINDKLISLESRRPQNVSAEEWEANVTWASIAFSNVCFSENHAPYVRMREFEVELNEKLSGDIDVVFFEWVWEQLEETGPQGKKYVARFRPQWRATARNASIQDDFEQSSQTP